MSIIYALVARGKDTTLVEYTTASGTFPLIARNLLAQVSKNEGQCFIPYNEKYMFHVVNASDFTYMCLTDVAFSKKNALAFLLNLQDRFLNTFSYDQRIAAINYSLNNAFADTIKKLMHQYSSDLEDDGLAKLKTNVADLKNYLKLNIDTLIERQDRIELLVRTTSSMNSAAENIKKQVINQITLILSLLLSFNHLMRQCAGQVRRETYWRGIRVKVLVGAAAALGTLGFIAIV